MTYYLLLSIFRLSSLDFPVAMLPDVTEPGAIAGSLKTQWYGVHPGTPVGTALGDLQCSIYTRMRTSNDAGKIHLNFC